VSTQIYRYRTNTQQKNKSDKGNVSANVDFTTTTTTTTTTTITAVTTTTTTRNNNNNNLLTS